MKRLFDEDGSELELRLLRSASLDVPATDAADRLLASLLDAEPVAAAVMQPKVARSRLQKIILPIAFPIAAGVAVLIRARHERSDDRPEIAMPDVLESQAAPSAAPAVEPAVTALPPPSAARSPVPLTSPVVKRPPPAPPASSSSLVEALQKVSGDAGTTPFDRGQSAALMAIDVSPCGELRGPSGAGHLTVTFAPDGTVSGVVVDAVPFSGTERGACVAGKYRAVKVPPFAGSSVRVGKSFVIDTPEKP